MRTSRFLFAAFCGVALFAYCPITRSVSMESQSQGQGEVSSKENDLITMLSSSDEKMQLKALEELREEAYVQGKIKAGYLPYLSKAIRNPFGSSDSIIIAILQHINSSLGRACIDDVLRRLQKESADVSSKRGWIAVLGRIGTGSDPGVVETLAKILAKDPVPLVRREAAMSLDALKGNETEIVRVLERTRQSPDCLVRIPCAFGIWKRTQSGEAIKTIVNCVRDCDPEVRRDAAATLYVLARTPPRKHLTKDLSGLITDALKGQIAVEENQQVKFWATQALEMFTEESH